ncbi:hypothetical protein HPG69_006762 [Diceros bicornis minor]|uniref:Uncharacterized protein n=1 Tax=Diceros bicornis minor TaxID=77932 RepID=A0A7J7F246_DICBM|nr:hypothetical protein HPG69_006762 [Diceros bicornis minor]
MSALVKTMVVDVIMRYSIRKTQKQSFESSLTETESNYCAQLSRMQEMISNLEVQKFNKSGLT